MSGRVNIGFLKKRAEKGEKILGIQHDKNEVIPLSSKKQNDPSGYVRAPDGSLRKIKP